MIDRAKLKIFLDKHIASGEYPVTSRPRYMPYPTCFAQNAKGNREPLWYDGTAVIWEDFELNYRGYLFAEEHGELLPEVLAQIQA